jgi:hypothetical protein
MGIHPNDIQLYLFLYNVKLPIRCIKQNLMNWALREVLNRKFSAGLHMGCVFG